MRPITQHIPALQRPPATDKAAQHDYFRALVQELEQYRLSQNVALEMMAGLIRNHVLTCELVIIGADGNASRQWHLPAASVAITPAKLTGALTVTAGSAPSGQAPNQGVAMGVYGITGTPTNAVYPTRVFNVSGRAITVYGNVGDSFTLQAFTIPQPPA